MTIDLGTRQLTGADMHRLLIVDNEDAVGFSMSEYFRLHGYHVDYAHDRFEAEDLLLSSDYEVLIEDLWLSNSAKDGLDIIQLVHERNPATQIVVLTARGSAENEKEARRRGASAFLNKPQSLREIAQVINALLGLRDEQSKLKTDAAST